MARGALWFRLSLSKGGRLHEGYGVLGGGKIDVYQTEEVSVLTPYPSSLSVVLFEVISPKREPVDQETLPVVEISS
jgi:hypothetical protein